MKRKDKKGRNLKTGESQRPDGRYMYRYLNHQTGRRESIYSMDLAELREQERIIIRALEDGIQTNPINKKITLNEYLEQYIKTRRLADSTLANYNGMWECIGKDTIGKMKMVHIKSSHIRGLYSEMDRNGYARSTIKLIHGILFPCFELAVEDDLIRKNPAKHALGLNGKAAQERKALSEHMQKRLLDYVRDHNIYRVYLPFLRIAIGTCCRCGELIGLTWDDVDFEREEITIDKQLIYKNYGDGYRFHLTTPKTANSIRKIPMSQEVKDAFRKQKLLNEWRGYPQDIEVEGYSGFVFIGKNGNPMMPSAVNHFLLNIVNAYNEEEMDESLAEEREAELMPLISAHTLRHTGCTRMAERGVDMKVVQHIMGHAGIGVTLNVYTHIADENRMRTEIAKMNEPLEPENELENKVIYGSFGVKVV